MKSKKELRLHYLSIFQNDPQIILNLQDFIKNYQSVGLYMPFSHEVDITPLFTMDKEIYLPYTLNKKEMEFRKFISFDLLEKDFANILAPKGSSKVPEVIVLPVVACNIYGYRLGHGGGYYDRYLANHEALKIAIVLEKCLIDDHFEESHDVRVDYIITEKRIIKV